MPSPQPFLWILLLLVLTACGTNDRYTPTSHGKSVTQTSKLQSAQKMTEANDPNMYHATSDDPEMNLAIAKARFSLPRFDSALASGKYDKELYMIKVRFATPSGSYEHIWLTDIKKISGHYKGIVSDSPYEATQVHEGDTLQINNDDITDWMYGTYSLVHGGYTTRLILSRMTPEQRDKQELGYSHQIED